MDLINVFYLAGIIFMVMVFVMLIATVIFLFKMKNKVASLQQKVKQGIVGLQHMRAGRDVIAEDAGALLAEITGKK